MPTFEGNKDNIGEQGTCVRKQIFNFWGTRELAESNNLLIHIMHLP